MTNREKGRRGRPKKNSANKKSAQLSVRVSSALEAALREAASKREPSRTLSQEVEQRLRLSFEQDRMTHELFGGYKTFWLFKILADALGDLQNRTERRWWKDRYTFLQMRELISTTLEMLEVQGKMQIPPHLKNQSQVPPAMRSDPATLGREIMLINLWSLDWLAEEDQEHPRSLEVIASESDRQAAAHLSPNYTSSPMDALSKLKESGRKRSKR